MRACSGQEHLPSLNSSGIAQFRSDIYGRDAEQDLFDGRPDALVVSESRAVTP